MKNAENLKPLLHAMNGFSAAYHNLNMEIDRYEHDTGLSVNDLPGFTESYPFDKSFDELDVDNWVTATVERVRQAAFKVLNYTYMNTGGTCMVGIFEVWLPELKQVVYALTNEEGCTLSVVDYISNELEEFDYDELTIESVDWGRVTGHEKYFELYRYCLNEYTKDDCKYFGITRCLQYHLLSDELQKQIDADYLVYCEAEHSGLIDTDGYKIIVYPDYEVATRDKETGRHLQEIKDYKQWHNDLINDATTDEVLDKFYNEYYTITFNGKSIKLPFQADVFNSINDLLDFVIREW